MDLFLNQTSKCLSCRSTACIFGLPSFSSSRFSLLRANNRALCLMVEMFTVFHWRHFHYDAFFHNFLAFEELKFVLSSLVYTYDNQVSRWGTLLSLAVKVNWYKFKVATQESVSNIKCLSSFYWSVGNRGFK